jgi:hypothetical protein
MWPFITGAVAVSPRTTVLISSADSGGIVSGDLKLIFGVQKFAFWQSPIYPNASGPIKGEPFDCGRGCLFNVTADPSERHDLALVHPDQLRRLIALFHTLNTTMYNPPQTKKDAAACSDQAAELSGFNGPYYWFAP